MIQEIIENNLFEAGLDDEIIEYILNSTNIYLEYDSVILNNKLLAVVELLYTNSRDDLTMKEVYEVVEKKISKILSTKH